MRITKMLRISEESLEQLEAIAKNEGITRGRWVEWAIKMAFQYLPEMKRTKLEERPNPFQTWDRSVAPKGELPPGYTDEETN